MTAVRFLGLGDGEFEDITLEVDYIAEFPRAPWEPHRGTCAFCFGDPTAEEPCVSCRGGYIHHGRSGETPLAGLDVHVAPNGRWFWQHVPHQDGCTVLTYIDRWYAACPDYAPGETCPVCNGRPT